MEAEVKKRYYCNVVIISPEMLRRISFKKVTLFFIIVDDKSFVQEEKKW